VALGSTTRVVLPFSSNEDEIITSLRSLRVEEGATAPFDFGAFFTTIEELAGPSIAAIRGPKDISHLTRVVLFYGRSTQEPVFGDMVGDEGPLARLTKHGSFFIDLLYMWERSEDDDAMCQQIYAQITSVLWPGAHGKELSLSQCAGSSRLVFNIQALMAHPVQRDHQDHFLKKAEYVPTIQH